MRAALRTTALLATLLAGCSPPAQPEPVAASTPERPAAAVDARGLALELEAPEHAFHLRGFDALEAYLVNEGSETVTVVLPGDGSDVGWRTPVVRWDPHARGVARCGNINPASEREIVALRPGERVALDWIGRPSFDGPGTYAVSLELEHEPDLAWKGVPLGEHEPEALRRIRAVEAFRVRSNTLELRVVE